MCDGAMQSKEGRGATSQEAVCVAAQCKCDTMSSPDAVSRGGATMTPAVLPAVSYRDGRRGQPRGPELPEQCSLIPRDGGPRT